MEYIPCIKHVACLTHIHSYRGKEKQVRVNTDRKAELSFPGSTTVPFHRTNMKQNELMHLLSPGKAQENPSALSLLVDTVDGFILRSSLLASI